MKASSAAAWLAVGLATLAAAAPAGAQGPVELSRSPIPENAAWKSYVLGTGTADVAPVRIASVVRIGDERGGAGRSVEGAGHADLHGGWSGAGGHARLRPRGRRPAVLHRERGHARRSGHVRDAAQRLQRDAPVPVHGGQHDADAARGGGRHQPQGRRRRRTSSSATRCRSARETATITAVGTQARSTTLFAAAPAGATNVKVAATTGLADGDALRVDGETRDDLRTSAPRAATRRSRRPPRRGRDERQGRERDRHGGGRPDHRRRRVAHDPDGRHRRRQRHRASR